jgi:hypothetical protein
VEWRQRPSAWHWLAPAMAVFLLGMFIVGRNSTEFEGGAATAWAASAIGHPQLSAYSEAMHHSDANSPPVTTLESTFASTSESYSPKAPAPMGQTNSLKQ